jgi:hypothetical protein
LPTPCTPTSSTDRPDGSASCSAASSTISSRRPTKHRGRIVEGPLPDLADPVQELEIDRLLEPCVVGLAEPLAEVGLVPVEHLLDRLRQPDRDLLPQHLDVEVLALVTAHADELCDQRIREVLVDDREHAADHGSRCVSGEHAQDVRLARVGRRSNPDQKLVGERVGDVVALLESQQRHARSPVVLLVGECERHVDGDLGSCEQRDSPLEPPVALDQVGVDPEVLLHQPGGELPHRLGHVLRALGSLPSESPKDGAEQDNRGDRNEHPLSRVHEKTLDQCGREQKPAHEPLWLRESWA